MTFEQLCLIVEETENQLILESLMDKLSNTKALVAAGLLVGITHFNYTIPKLREIINSRLEKTAPTQLQKIEDALPRAMSHPKVEEVVSQIIEEPKALPKAIPVDEPPEDDDQFFKKAMAYIIPHEGVINKLYKDVYGLWTIGIGHLVKPHELEGYKGRTLSKKEIYDLFVQDANKKLELAKSHFGPKWTEFPTDLKIMILDGYFRGDLSGSPNTRKLISQGRYKEAAAEYLNNKEYKQAVKNKTGVATRMAKNAAILTKL